MSDDRVTRLKQLARMLDEGRITEEEYLDLKEDVMSDESGSSSLPQQVKSSSPVETSTDLSRRSIVIGIVVVLIVVGIIWAVQENQARQAAYDSVVRDLVDQGFDE